jgi:hypothetical protein
MSAPASTPGLSTLGVGLAWVLLVLFCLWGTPPLVDLPAHGAQLQLMRAWLAGDEATRQQFSLHFSLGYGLWSWCVLPLAFALNGAWAAKGAVLLYLLALPASLHFYLRRLGQPPWLTLLALPLCFSVSYWYGFISTLVTLPAIFLGLGLFGRWSSEHRRADAWGTWACLAFCALNHPLSYAALAAALLGTELTQARSPAQRLWLVGLAALPGLLLVPYGLAWLERSGLPTDPGFSYRLDTHHLAWFWKNTRSEGVVSLLLPLGLFGAVLVQRVRGRAGAREALGACAGVSALYLAVPYNGGGALMLDVRLPVLVAGLALGALRVDGLANRWRLALCGLALLSLAETAFVHHRFRAFAAPAEAVFLDRRTVHSTADQVSIPPFSRHPFLEHFFEWETARYGGFGDHLFADARHVPIQARRDVPPPAPEVQYGYGVSPTPRACVLEVERLGFSRFRCLVSSR